MGVALGSKLCKESRKVHSGEIQSKQGVLSRVKTGNIPKNVDRAMGRFVGLYISKLDYFPMFIYEIGCIVSYSVQLESVYYQFCLHRSSRLF